MVMPYTTLSQAQTFIRVYNSVPHNDGTYAKLGPSAPGHYTVLIAK